MTKKNLLTDPLTGLTNRLGLEASLTENTFANGISEQKGLLLLEMSRFSNVTDSIGSALGDKVIIKTAKRLQKIFPHATVIARTHGDHFCLLFEGEFNLSEEIERVHEFTQRPLVMRGEVIVLSVRIGAAQTIAGDQSPIPVFHCAEIALHRAKLEGLNSCFYNESFKVDAQASHKLENDLRVSLITNHSELHRGINNNEFRLLYQPIVDVSNQQVNAFEALIRWYHPTRGFVSPADFIPMAEAIQILDVLGSWVFKKACEDAVNWPQNNDGSSVGVSINVSPTQFINADILVNTAKEALEQTGIDPSIVKIELTESSAFGKNMLETLERLKEMGFKLSLDDFGTGYSSLTQLNDLPLDFLKLDQSFVRKIGGEDEQESDRSIRMTKSILSLADGLGFTTIIEGIEDKQQLDIVCNAGANLIQGYYFSKPLPYDETETFILNMNKEFKE